MNGTRHYTSTSLIMKRRLTVQIGEHYGNSFDIMEFLRRLSILYGTHRTDYTTKSYIQHS
ncbi:unnamed protein product [Schistosoma margrebowiei]|uniref:Uncharacterized protein n=1 Tax=Schistosoma margrebowiei TaxID=48269 RepID=A0A3P7VU53_9TREM|nr:unnamed protein product [Schistosoma margrebowiei]